MLDAAADLGLTPGGGDITPRSDWDALLGPFVGAEDLATVLGITVENLDELVARNEVLQLRLAATGEPVYPTFQVQAVKLVPRLSELLRQLAPYGVWARASWLVAPGDDGRSAIDVLRRGDRKAIDAVMLEARHDGAGFAAP